MNKKEIFLSILAFFISAIIVFYGQKQTNFVKVEYPGTAYRVYLEGKSIGIIKSKEELENYIDKKQEAIKKKYDVDKVYAPNDLDIVKEITYSGDLSSIDEIYSKIKETKGDNAFTIEGYKIVIAGVDTVTEQGTTEGEDKVIYTLDKATFTEAVYNTLYAFIDKETYQKFINDEQEEIEDYGKIIEDCYVENNLTVTKENIPTSAKIFTEEEELSKYLLFGTTENQAVYTVKQGDTIEDVAYANKISNEEFLIANPDFTSVNDLLFPGQQVTLGVLQPLIQVVEEDHVVANEVTAMATKYEYDSSKYTDYELVKQEGQSGESIVTQKIKLINGEAKEYVPITTEVVTPEIDEIIVKGSKQYGSSTVYVDVSEAVNGTWVWPTRTPYGITSTFGWRWGKLHEGIDISGPGYGSPIYAANNGAVIQSSYTSMNGNYILIKHSNGYYTIYAHLASRYVYAGSQVNAGQVIGTMGKTGFATGVHLHFGAYNGMPYRGGVPFDPRRLY